MRLKVISDGTKNGTRVVNEQTGETVEGVRGVEFTTRTTGDNCHLYLSLEETPCEMVSSPFPSGEIRVELPASFPACEEFDHEQWFSPDDLIATLSAFHKALCQIPPPKCGGLPLALRE